MTMTSWASFWSVGYWLPGNLEAVYRAREAQGILMSPQASLAT